MLFFYAEGTEHCRTKGQTPPPNQRAGVPADHGRAGLSQSKGRADYGRAGLSQPEGRADYGAGALVAAQGARRPWGGRACCSPRDAPTMGRAGLSQPEGRADHGAGALVAARGARRPWGGRACCSSAAAELAKTFFRSCPLAGRAKQVNRSAAARAEQENPARSKAYRAFARRWHGKTGVANF